jgi:hypothetical protein
MADFESGRQALQTLLSTQLPAHGEAGPDRNEASTKYHVIDPLLSDVLGWPTSLIEVERHEESGFSDYELGSPPSLLIEAKREGVYFSVPAGWAREVAKLETLFAASKEVEKAVRQAMDYALQRGIPLAAVSNGLQVIAFVASRQDGIPPLRGSALIFPSLHDMLARFSQMWDALSPAGVAAGNLARILSAMSLSAPPEKLSARIVGYPGFKNRNPIATELQILGGIFLEDIARDPELEDEFLKDTYCTSGALSQYALVSRELLRARYASTFEKNGGVSATPATTKKGLSPELQRDIIAASLSRRPILLVGDIGVGKSIFIRHLIRVDAREPLERAFVLYIDFGSKPALANELRPYIVDEIIRQLLHEHHLDVYERNFVRGVYHGELRRFEGGIYADLKDADPAAYRAKEIQHLEHLTGNAEEHLKACMTHAVRGQQRQIVLFLDNVDQRPGQFQEEVFLISQALADQWPLTAFVALRPETFAESRARGYLAAYQPRVFTIDPPRVDRVLSRRLAFAKRQLEERGRLGSLSANITVQAHTLTLYVEMLVRAVETDPSIVEFIDNMSAGNIRLALGFVAAFIGSGHVDSQRILRAQEEQAGGYTLPLHEFLRAVAYGDCEHYNPSQSPLMNVYDIATADGREHFLVALLIAFVERAGQLGGSEGYVGREEAFRFAQGLGFQAQQVQRAVERCIQKRLLATPASLTGEGHLRLRITTAGAYSVKRLMFLYTYLDAIIVDTPIVDPHARSLLQDVADIEGRLARVECFLGYLESQWRELKHDALSVLDWPAGAAMTRKEVAGIRERLQRKAKERSPEPAQQRHSADGAERRR